MSNVYRLSEAKRMKNKIEAVVANGTPRNRKKMAEVLRQAGIPLVNLIDPSVIISPSALISGGKLSFANTQAFPVMPL